MSGNALDAMVQADDGQTGYERCRAMALAMLDEPCVRDAIKQAAGAAKTGSGERVLRGDIEWCAEAACAGIVADAAVAALRQLFQKEQA